MSRDEEGHGLPDDLQRTRPYDLGVMLVHGIGQQRHRKPEIP